MSAERLRRLAYEHLLRQEMDSHPVEREDWPHGDEPHDPADADVPERGRDSLWRVWP